jgi:hypothetical protein
MDIHKQHGLGQCWCGQYHLTAVTPFSSTTIGITPGYTTTLRGWEPVVTNDTSAMWETPYEGRHRSE